MPIENTVKELKMLDWFHPGADRHVAESLLMQNGEEGHYLLRPNTSDEVFTLSIRAKESVKHFQITVTQTEILFGFGKFKNVNDLLKHFSNKPLIAGESGVPVMLKNPYPSLVPEISHYEQVRVHAEMRIEDLKNENFQSEQSHLATASKEGFLTKQGGRIKNWKCRWCVLHKLDLRYFKHRLDHEPLRTIDLKECLSCSADKSLNQEHCFALKLSWRTFYFCASSEQEMTDWIKMINWKLESIKKKSRK